MAFRGSTDEIRICFPLCFLGSLEPPTLTFVTILWDIFVFVSWFIYNLCLIDQISVGPLIISFIFILILFPVVWDARDPKGRYTILKYYSGVRIAQAAIMSVACLTFFILIFVFIANSTLEQPLLNKYWALGLFLYFLPVSIIHWGSTFTFSKAQKFMRINNSSEATTRSLNNTATVLRGQNSFVGGPLNTTIGNNMNRLTQI